MSPRKSNEDLATEAVEHAIRYGMELASAHDAIGDLIAHHHDERPLLPGDDRDPPAEFKAIRDTLDSVQYSYHMMTEALAKVQGWPEVDA